MKIRATLTLAALALFVASCANPVAPVPADDSAISSLQAQQTGKANRCYGQIISGIASTWPWARDHTTFPPPKGSLALWVELFLPEGTTVRDLQILFCR